MPVSGFSTAHDPEVAEYQRTRAIILARQEQKRQEVRRQLGLPEPVPVQTGLGDMLRGLLGKRSKQERWVDGLIEEERKGRGGNVDEKGEKRDLVVEVEEVEKND